MFWKQQPILAELNREIFLLCVEVLRFAGASYARERKQSNMLIRLTVFATRSCFKVHGWSGGKCKISATTIESAICTFGLGIRRDKHVGVLPARNFVNSPCYHARNRITKHCAIECQRLMCLETAIAFQALQITLVVTITDIKAWKLTIKYCRNQWKWVSRLSASLSKDGEQKLQAQARRRYHQWKTFPDATRRCRNLISLPRHSSETSSKASVSRWISNERLRVNNWKKKSGRSEPSPNAESMLKPRVIAVNVHFFRSIP